MKTMVILAKTKEKPNPVQNKPLTKFYHKPKMKQSRKHTEKHLPWVPEVIPFPNIKQSLTQSLPSPDRGWRAGAHHCQPAPGLKFHQTLSKTGQVVQEIKEELGKDLGSLFHPHYLQPPTSARGDSIPLSVSAGKRFWSRGLSSVIASEPALGDSPHQQPGIAPWLCSTVGLVMHRCLQHPLTCLQVQPAPGWPPISNTQVIANNNCNYLRLSRHHDI